MLVLHVTLRLVIAGEHGVHVLIIGITRKHLVPVITHRMSIRHRVSLVVEVVGSIVLLVVHHVRISSVVHRPLIVCIRVSLHRLV